MKVIAYWADLGPEYPFMLINRWRKSWMEHGFEPLIMKAKDAQEHPRYEEILAWTETVPTVNDRRFESACWVRWLAFELLCRWENRPVIVADYDVINYGFRPGDCPAGKLIDLGSMAFYASWEGIQEFIEFWPKAKPINVGGKDHLSDYTAMTEFHWRRQACVVAGDVREVSAPLVHFANAYVKPEWQQWNRHLAVADLDSRRV